MKKAVYFAIAVAFCLSILCGCTSEAAETDIQEESCRVLCLKEDGIVIAIIEAEQTRYVYVKHVDADLGIEPLDTVVIEFAEQDLKSESGTFTDAFGEEQDYSYILETPKSIRLADSSVGEPTYG
jgi:hypothetical protein